MSIPKTNFISNAATAAQNAVNAIQALASLYQTAIDEGYQAGGANAIVDADFVGNNAFMTAAQLQAALTVFNTINTNLAANNRAGWVALKAVVANPT